MRWRSHRPRERVPLSDRDIARATGAGVSTVSAWLAARARAARACAPSGSTELSRRSRRWLATSCSAPSGCRLAEQPIPALERRKPLDVIAAGRLRAVMYRAWSPSSSRRRSASDMQPSTVAWVPVTGQLGQTHRAGGARHRAVRRRRSDGWQRGEQLRACTSPTRTATRSGQSWYRALAELGERTGRRDAARPAPVHA